MAIGGHIEGLSDGITKESLMLLEELDATALMNMLVPAIIFYSGINVLFMSSFHR